MWALLPAAIFIRYLTVFCIGTLFLALILVVCFSTLLSSGAILPANYAEKQALAAKATIAASVTVTPNLIPDLCKYAVYTADGKIISGNLNFKEGKKSMAACKRMRAAMTFTIST